MGMAEGKKLLQRSKMVYEVEGGLRRTGEPTYLRPTQDPAANLNPVVTANPYTQLDLDEGEREEYQFDPAMVNDIMGYPEDYDVPIVQGDEINMEDLDVGELQKFGTDTLGVYHHADASVPVTPPGDTQIPVYTSVLVESDWWSHSVALGTRHSERRVGCKWLRGLPTFE